MKFVRTFLLGFFVLANMARANTFGSDMTDLWWNANESGWGVTAAHQGDVVFLTFFVYGMDNRPTFYTASTTYSGSTGQGAYVFSGPMYQTSGPWHGMFFNPNLVGVRQVGTATFTAFLEAAALTYSVDGVLVTKSLTRQTFRANTMTGQYGGVINQSQSGCANPFDNGSAEVTAGISMSNSATTLSMTTNSGGQVCTYTGDYIQTGRMGSSTGTYVCPGISGTYDLFELEATPRSITGRFTARDNLCSQITGRFAAVKR